jgi:hypothetical protein
MKDFSKRERDYNRFPNRFTFKVFHNNRHIVECDRHFDASFFDVEDNFDITPAKFKRNAISNERFANSFENSLEAVTLGEEISKLFRYILKRSTEEYLWTLHTSERSVMLGKTGTIKESQKRVKTKEDATQEIRQFQEELQDWDKSRRGTLKFQIVDKQHPLRTDGVLEDKAKITHRLDHLREKKEFDGLTAIERAEYEALNAKFATLVSERVIFETVISTDEFALRNDFSLPIHAIWKDFNINLTPQDRSEDALEFSESYVNARVSEVFRLKNAIANLREKGEEFEKLSGHIEAAAINKEISKLEDRISKIENMSFKGIRHLIQDAFRSDFTNRFTEPILVNCNFSTNQAQIVEKSYYTVM